MAGRFHLLPGEPYPSKAGEFCLGITIILYSTKQREAQKSQLQGREVSAPASHVAGILNLLWGGGEAGSGCFLGIYFLFLFGVCGLRQKFMAEVDLLYNPRAAL